MRTFLGRRGNVNKGIAATLSKEPAHFFAYNNGIATTASAVTTVKGPGSTQLLTGLMDLQIVNGAQTTASLASLRLAGKFPLSAVFISTIKLPSRPPSESNSCGATRGIR